MDPTIVRKGVRVRARSPRGVRKERIKTTIGDLTPLARWILSTYPAVAGQTQGEWVSAAVLAHASRWIAAHGGLPPAEAYARAQERAAAARERRRVRAEGTS